VTMKRVLGNKKVFIAFTALLLTGVAVAALAANGEAPAPESGAVLKDFLYRCLDFVILFGGLAYFCVKPIRQGLAGRREGVEKALREAEAARVEAEAKFAEYDRKLTKAAAEIEDLSEGIRREGELEREKILAGARESAEKIKREAEKSAAYEISRARGELRREAAQLAIEIAEDLLNRNLTQADHARLVDEYMLKVGELH
jgi:F-type H+-transporting ATPase subunit b